MNCSQEHINSAFKDIVSDELQKLNQQSAASEVPSSLSGEDDVLWEYDGLHTADKAECEDILLEMQRIFYEDIRLELSQKGMSHPLTSRRRVINCWIPHNTSSISGSLPNCALCPKE